MITVTVPYPGHEVHAVTWRETLSDARYVYAAIGADLRAFAGRRSGDCAEDVRVMIAKILEDPSAARGLASHWDMQAVTENLVRLFFTLRRIPDGTVQVR